MTSSPAKRRDCHGFTLLEVLLASILSATLLALLWSLFSVYLRLFDSASAQAEQVQLARALLGQLSDDLHSAIEDAPDESQADDTGRTSPVRRFGLLGTEDTLRFDVLQVIPLEESPALQGDVTDGLRGVKVRQVPELRTISYSFRRSDRIEQEDTGALTADEVDAVTRPGLTRRELDYETPEAELEAPAVGRRFPGVVSAGMGLAEGKTDQIVDESIDPELEDDSIMWIPEVAGLKFRYFDGSGFSSEWNSLERKSLPSAIEVTLQLRSPEEAKPARPTTGETELDGLEPDLEETLDDVEKGRTRPEQVETAIYSLLIDLPSAKNYSGIKRPARVGTMLAERTGPIVPAPLAVPGLLTIRPAGSASRVAKKSDQWMRTGP